MHCKLRSLPRLSTGRVVRLESVRAIRKLGVQWYGAIVAHEILVGLGTQLSSKIEEKEQGNGLLHSTVFAHSSDALQRGWRTPNAEPSHNEEYEVFVEKVSLYLPPRSIGHL